MSVFSAEAWAKVWTYRGTFLLGLRNTAATAVFAILLALTLGIVFGLCATGKSRLLRGVARAYVEVIQNTPVLRLSRASASPMGSVFRPRSSPVAALM